MTYLFLLLKRFYFFIALSSSIILASITVYITGYTHSTSTINSAYYLTNVIFLLTGILIKRDDLLKAIKDYRAIVAVNIFSFLVSPVVAQIFVTLLLKLFSIDFWIGKGLLAIACMPPSFRSAAFDSCKGDEAPVVVNLILGKLLGIILTPVLLLVQVGLATSIPIGRTLTALTRHACLPLLIGYILRQVISYEINEQYVRFLLNAVMIYSIYLSYVDIFNTELIISAQHVLVGMYSAMVLHVLLLIIIYSLCLTFKWKGKKVFTPKESIIVMFCATQKSIGIAFPLLRTLFVGYSHMFPITLTLYSYYTVQLIFGAVIGPLFGTKNINVELNIV